MQKWIVRITPTKYPDLFNYDVLEINPDYMQGKTNSFKTYAVACGLDSKENANLISSSPDLYESLNAIINHFRENDLNYYTSDLCTDAIIALKKSRGEI